jgi:hypothetical protein
LTLEPLLKNMVKYLFVENFSIRFGSEYEAGKSCLALVKEWPNLYAKRVVNFETVLGLGLTSNLMVIIYFVSCKVRVKVLMHKPRQLLYVAGSADQMLGRAEGKMLGRAKEEVLDGPRAEMLGRGQTDLQGRAN